MAAQIRLALIEDSRADSLIFQDMLLDALPSAQIQCFRDAQSFIASLDSAEFDCIVLDNQLPDATGLELVQDLRAREATRFVPLILLTGLGNEKLAVKAMKYGASDYLSKRTADAQALGQAVHAAIKSCARERQEAEHSRILAERAATDALTGLLNRAEFDRRLGAAVEPVHGEARPFALIYLDLDRFKPVNDLHGHLAGDAVLREIADRLRDSVRAGDLVFRLGGDEFAALIPDDSGTGQLRELALRMLVRIREPIELEQPAVTLSVGASVGIARYPQCGRSAREIVLAADKAMYLCKEHGTDIEFAPDE